MRSGFGRTWAVAVIFAVIGFVGIAGPVTHPTKGNVCWAQDNGGYYDPNVAISFTLSLYDPNGFPVPDGSITSAGFINYQTAQAIVNTSTPLTSGSSGIPEADGCAVLTLNITSCPPQTIDPNVGALTGETSAGLGPAPETTTIYVYSFSIYDPLIGSGGGSGPIDIPDLE